MQFPSYFQPDISVKLDDIMHYSENGLSDILYWPERESFVFQVFQKVLRKQPALWTLNLRTEEFSKFYQFGEHVFVGYFQIAAGYLSCSFQKIFEKDNEDNDEEEEKIGVWLWKYDQYSETDPVCELPGDSIVASRVYLRTITAKFLFRWVDGVIHQYSIESPERGVICSSIECCLGSYSSIYVTKDEDRLIVTWMEENELNNHREQKFCVFNPEDLTVLHRFAWNDPYLQMDLCQDPDIFEVKGGFLFCFPKTDAYMFQISGEKVEIIELNRTHDKISNLLAISENRCLATQEGAWTEDDQKGFRSTVFITSVCSIDLTNQREEHWTCIKGTDADRSRVLHCIRSFCFDNFVWISFLELYGGKYTFHRIQLMWNALWPRKIRSFGHDVFLKWI